MAGQPLATDVTHADTLLRQTLGAIGKKRLSDGWALVFPQPGAFRVPIHMLGVRTDLDAIWLLDERVQRVETLSAWTGLGVALADTVVELPAGAASDVSVGDRITIDDDAITHSPREPAQTYTHQGNEVSTHE